MYKVQASRHLDLVLGLSRAGRVVRPPRIAKYKGRQNEYFIYKIIYSALKSFKLLKKYKASLVNNMNFLKVRNFCQAQSL